MVGITGGIAGAPFGCRVAMLAQHSDRPRQLRLQQRTNQRAVGGSVKFGRVETALVSLPWASEQAAWYIPSMDRDYWTKALREAERELEAVATPTAINAAATKVMRAKAELQRLQVETQPNPV